MFRSSRDIVEPALAWGDSPPSSAEFPPCDCWALRRGRPYFSPGGDGNIRCEHVSKDADCSSLCVPILAHGETIGIIHLCRSCREASGPISAQHAPGGPIFGLALQVGEQAGLALGNLQLRETLKQQSIRDPLTGLYNRRFLDESLEREIRRAARGRKNVGLIALDVDHFKKFNDTFGHDAGDCVLQSVGELIRAHLRAEDFPCRYGGEEFFMILPEASVAVSNARAEKIRTQVKYVELERGGQSLGRITVSLGVAEFPEHGTSAMALMRAADAALYRAKEGGRDRVVVAHASTNDMEIKSDS
jgi:diguanylate cyclase (GGDEF)-like protein